MKVLLFDIDGTLLNTGGAGLRAMELALMTSFGVTRATEGIPAAGRTDRAIIADLFAYHGVQESPEVWHSFQQIYFRHLAEVLPTLPGHTLPGIERLLNLLSARDDILLGLLTGNFARGASLKLAHFGIEHYFQCGGFGDDHHDRNDVARAALESVRQHQKAPVDPRHIWVIGDTPSDVRCGRAIGARVVAVATGSFTADVLEAEKPDYLFDNFADPQSLLALV